MRVLHVSNDHHPTVMGGTEVFVARLIAAQQQLPEPYEIRWAAHHKPGQSERRTAVDGVQVDLPTIVA